VTSAAVADRLLATTDGSFSRPAAPSRAKTTSASRVGLCCGCRFIASSFRRCSQLPNYLRNGLFRHLGECVLFQLQCVGVEFADAFGQLVRCHRSSIMHAAESFIAKTQALVVARLRDHGVKLAVHWALGLLQVIEKVWTNGEQGRS